MQELSGWRSKQQFSFARCTALVMLSILTMAATVPVAGARTDTVAAAKQQSGGTLRVAVRNEVPALSLFGLRIGSPNGLAGHQMFAIFGTLLRVDPKTLAAVPYMAQSMTTSDGGTTWTLKIKPNIKFSDGTPYDANAVVFTWKLLQDPANAFNSLSVVQAARSVTAVDALTVQFVLTSPDGSFPQIFTDTAGAIVSPTAYQSYPAVKGSSNGFWQKPVGAGPFVLKSWVRDQTMTLAKNPTYFEKGLPYLDEIEFRVIPDQTAQGNLLLQGQIDMLVGGQTPQLAIAAANPTKLTAPDLRKTSGALGIISNAGVAPGNDPRWREAMTLAFDWNVSKQILLSNLPFKGKLTCMPFGTASPYCAKDVSSQYDPKRAQKLLDSYRADGFSTDVTLLGNLPESAPGVTEYIQQQLAKLGVKVTVRTVPTAQFTPLVNASEYQISITFVPTQAYPGIRYYDDYHSKGGVKGGQDRGQIDNAELNVALEKGRYSVSQADQIAGWQEAQRIFTKKAFAAAWLAPLPGANVTTKQVDLGPEQDITTSSIRFAKVSLKGTK